MDFVTAILSFFIACGLSVGLQIFFFSPISPELLHRPPPSLSPQSNSKLQEVSFLGEGILVKPEDVVVDENGVLYTATRDGWIKRLHKNGTWENWRWIDSQNLLGICTAAAGGLYVCDAQKGVLKVAVDGITAIVSHTISFADDVIEASDGSIYFSVASTKFDLHNWFLDVLEAKSHGQLLKFDPSSNQTSILLDNLSFANGVTLSADQDYLIVCETWKYRCIKYWLKTESRGQTEIFIDNLPGGPDNINLAPDGTFWIAMLEIIPPWLSYLHKSRVLKHIVATFPSLMRHANGAYNKAMVANVDQNGKIIKFFDDPTGKIMSFVTSAFEFDDHLYLGSLNCDYIGKLQLRVPSS